MFRFAFLSGLLATSAAFSDVFNSTSSSFNLNEANKNVYLSAAGAQVPIFVFSLF